VHASFGTITSMAATPYHHETLSVEQAKVRLTQLRARRSAKRAADGSPVFFSSSQRAWIKVSDVARGVKLTYYRNCPCTG
jgi:hypothetical protein